MAQYQPHLAALAHRAARTGHSLQLDYRAYWRATTNDVWYRANGPSPARPLNAAARNASHFIGQELDLLLTWNIHPKVQFQGGYSHFFAGTYLSDTGSSDGADFVYAQVTFTL